MTETTELKRLHEYKTLEEYALALKEEAAKVRGYIQKGMTRESIIKDWKRIMDKVMREHGYVKKV